jgi:hypothetical protein
LNAIDQIRLLSIKPVINIVQLCFFFSQHATTIANPNGIPIKDSHGKVSKDLNKYMATHAVNKMDKKSSLNNDNSDLI